MNKIFLIGRLTKDPELSTTPSGVEVCKFTLAVDRKFKNKDGEKEADFLQIIAWRQLADICGKYLRKGKQTAIFGSVQTRTYDDKEGNRRYVTEVITEDMQMLGSKDSSESYEQEEIKQLEHTTKSGRKTFAKQVELDDDDDLPF